MMLFPLLNVFLYIIILSTFGYESSIYLSVVVSCFILLFYLKRKQYNYALCFPLIYMVNFDNEIFTFSDLKFRIYYPFIFIALIYYLKVIVIDKCDWKYFGRMQLRQISTLAAISYYFLMSIVFLFFEDFFTNINNVKYWIISFPLVIIWTIFKDKDAISILNFYVKCCLFIALFGFVQFFANGQGLDKLQLDYYAIRPSGFFSETSWYGESGVFALIASFYLYSKREISFNKVMLLSCIFTISIFLSVTRNAFLGLFIVMLLLTILVRTLRKKLILCYSGMFIVILILCVSVSFFMDLDLIGWITGRFSGDESSDGRIEAAEMTLAMMSRTGYFWGNGFYFDIFSNISSTGTSIGAKSANVFLFFLHVFGFVGLLVLLGLIFSLYIRIFNNRMNAGFNFGITGISAFLVMACFAPLHQYSSTLVSLGIMLMLVSLPKVTEERKFDEKDNLLSIQHDKS